MKNKTIIYLFISTYRCYGTVVMADIADDDFIFDVIFLFFSSFCSKKKLDTYARMKEKNWIFVYTAKAVASSKWQVEVAVEKII